MWWLTFLSCLWGCAEFLGLEWTFVGSQVKSMGRLRDFVLEQVRIALAPLIVINVLWFAYSAFLWYIVGEAGPTGNPAPAPNALD